jgi:hypothetical protein
MPDYSKLRELVSHRVVVEYDTGAKIVGYIAACRPSIGPVEFVKLSRVELRESSGDTIDATTKELWVCPNLLTHLSFEEGPTGRDV